MQRSGVYFGYPVVDVHSFPAPFPVAQPPPAEQPPAPAQPPQPAGAPDPTSAFARSDPLKALTGISKDVLHVHDTVKLIGFTVIGVLFIISVDVVAKLASGISARGRSR
jgi:hypothetical protein